MRKAQFGPVDSRGFQAIDDRHLLVHDAGLVVTGVVDRHSTTSKPTKDFPEIDERRTLHEPGLLPLVGSQMFGAMS